MIIECFSWKKFPEERPKYEDERYILHMQLLTELRKLREKIMEQMTQSLKKRPAFLQMLQYLGNKPSNLSIEYCEDQKIYHGEIQAGRDIITFQAQSYEELEKEMEESLEGYLEMK